jgi:hypothetical protein
VEVESVGVGTGGGRERPADVLLCRAQDVRVGAAGGSAVGRVALDVGIVCPQAGVHLDNAQEVLGAAEAYSRTKCDRAQMAERCRVAGVVFQPMIFECSWDTRGGSGVGWRGYRWGPRAACGRTIV